MIFVYRVRYEWVDVGMLDYDPATKLYRVKRVYVPDHILERNTAVATQNTEDEETEVWVAIDVQYSAAQQQLNNCMRVARISHTFCTHATRVSKYR